MTADPREIGAEHARARDAVALLLTDAHGAFAGLHLADVAALDDRGRGPDDARRLCALRLLVEHTDAPIASLDPAPLREAESALDELLDDDTLATALCALTPLLIDERPHGGSPLGALEVFRATVPGASPPRSPLADWHAGRLRLPAAVIRVLMALDGEPPPAAGLFFEEIAGLRWLPLRTPTLPPATHTNAFILGRGELTVVDPGADDPAEARRLADALRGLCGAGHRVARVLLTHHHPDHTRGLAAVRAEYPHAEVWVHHDWRGTPAEDAVVRRVGEGQGFGEGADRYVLLHTPGHAPEHLAVHHPASGALLCADLMASVGTIVVSPPDGNMTHYFASLRRALSLSPSVIYASHGPPIDDPVQHIRTYLAHRQQREDQILAALREAGRASALELVPRVYEGIPRAVWPLAERNVLAHLEKLADEALAVRHGEQWSAAGD